MSKDQGILQMRQDMHLQSYLVPCNDHGHGSQLQAGRQESGHCRAGREPATTAPECQAFVLL